MNHEAINGPDKLSGQLGIYAIRNSAFMYLFYPTCFLVQNLSFGRNIYCAQCFNEWGHRESACTLIAWMKVYRSIPEIRFLRLTFTLKVSPKILNLANCNSCQPDMEIWEFTLGLNHVILPRLSWEDCSFVVFELTHMVIMWLQCLVKHDVILWYCISAFSGIS